MWLALLSASLRGQMSYRGSFLLEVLGRFLVTGLELVAVLVLFSHIDGLGGWSRWEVVYLYGVASLSLGLAELGTDGLKDMPELVRTGGLDAILVRPCAPLIQVVGRRCRPLHLGRIGQGLLGIGLSLGGLQLQLDPLQLCMIPINVGCAALVYGALFVLGAATTVFTVQTTEAFNAFTYGGVQMTQYPVHIYRPWLVALFLFVVPVGYVTYLPALVVLDKPDVLGLGPVAPWLAPGVAAITCVLAGAWWRLCLGRYLSTGS